MELKFRTPRSEHDEIADRVYACMETGNTGVARATIGEYQEKFPEQAKVLVQDVIRQYGVRL